MDSEQNQSLHNKDFVDLELEENDIDNHGYDSKTPRLHMKFDTEDEAYDFYNEYARVTGFSIRKGTKHENNEGEVVYRKFVCSCAGKKGKDKRDVYYKKKRPETRFGCGAYMVVNARLTGKFEVVEFVAEHNGHTLVSPKKVHMLRSQRRIRAHQAAEIDNIDRSGIPPKRGLTYVSQGAGGRDKVGYTIQDLKNYLRSKRTIQMKEGDAGGLLNYLQMKQSKDPNFYNAIQVDEDDLITNIFWADGQMIADYAYFGDVVSFDTTYKTNKEGRPVALFIGVNHHKQSVVFGAAFLYDETAETFMWLFETFAEAMYGKNPVTILTDQDAAMAKALKEKWPGTIHRLCIWHIYQNAASQLSGVFENFPTFLQDFTYCIYCYEEEEDFLNGWHEILEKYKLQENEWLQKMFDKKEEWALVYGRQHFCADLTTTQRSESMNSALKKYVGYKHNLLQFFQHFDMLIDDRRYEELKADFRSNQTVINVSLSVEMLKHAREVYTHEVFLLFQEELVKSIDSKIEKNDDGETTFRYKVTPNGKKYYHTVTFDDVDNTVICSCKKFEFAGILCSHALKVLNVHNIMRIPDLYIMKRWTKCAKKGVVECFQPTTQLSSENLSEADEKKRLGERYRELCRLFSQLSTRAVRDEESFEFAKDICLKGLEEVDAMLGRKDIVKPSPAPTYVVKKALVSRVTKKQIATPVETRNQVMDTQQNMDSTVNVNENDSTEVAIRGVKIKPKSNVKSGKRLQSALEIAVKKKRQSRNTDPSSKKTSSSKTSGKNAQNSDTGNNLDTTTFVHMPPCPPMLPFSNLSQSNHVGHLSHNLVHPPWPIPYNNIEHNVSYFTPSQAIRPHVPQQMRYALPGETSEQQQHSSMVALLQRQMLGQPNYGMFSMNNSTTTPQQGNTEG